MSLNKPKSSELGHERIAPTALGVAYRRALAEIPFAQEIFAVLEKDADQSHLEQLKNPQLTPIIEARYRLLSRLAKRTNATQFLELASGYASRGLEFAQDPAITYVEFDLPQVMKQKERIVSSIDAGRSNLHFSSGNVLDIGALSVAVQELDSSKPITVLNEGLMRYLPFDEKTQLAKNVQQILHTFGGQWVTPDITLKSVIAMENRRSPGSKQALANVTGMDVDANAFDDVVHAETFFSNLGFSVEKHSFLEVVDELVSPGKLGQSEEDVQDELRDPVAFVLRPI